MLRDGSITYVDVFRPDVADKFPALLSRTASNKSSQSGRFEDLDPIKAASSGYAVVIQDVRGRHSSGGDFYAFVRVTKDLQRGWYCGAISKADFFKKARFVPAGEPDGSNKWIPKVDCYNVTIGDLTY